MLPLSAIDDLADDAVLGHRPLGLLDAGGERVGLVEARHDDRQLQLARRRGRGRRATTARRLRVPGTRRRPTALRRAARAAPRASALGDCRRRRRQRRAEWSAWRAMAQEVGRRRGRRSHKPSSPRAADRERPTAAQPGAIAARPVGNGPSRPPASRIADLLESHAMSARPADAEIPLPLLITGVAGVAGYNALDYFAARYPGQVVGIRQADNWPLRGPHIVACDAEDRRELVRAVRPLAVSLGARLRRQLRAAGVRARLAAGVADQCRRARQPRVDRLRARRAAGAHVDRPGLRRPRRRRLSRRRPHRSRDRLRQDDGRRRAGARRLAAARRACCGSRCRWA